MIYIITHKRVKIKALKSKGYAMLQVGGAFSEPIYDMVDSFKENISMKNKTFCELTGLYWIWKNCRAENIVGLVHYRRFFVYQLWKKIAGRIPIEYRMISEKSAEKILQKYDIIVPYKFKYGTTIWENYSKEHIEKDLIMTRQIIKDIYPDYIYDFDRILHGNEMYGCNMFIAKRKFVDNYCTWLFDILFELENKLDISEYSDYQKRVFGFLAERLFNVYLAYHDLNVYENIVDFIEHV